MHPQVLFGENQAVLEISSISTSVIAVHKRESSLTSCSILALNQVSVAMKSSNLESSKSVGIVGDLRFLVTKHLEAGLKSEIIATSSQLRLWTTVH